MWKVVLFTALFEGSKHENLRSIFKIQNPFLHAKCYFWDPFSKSKIHFLHAKCYFWDPFSRSKICADIRLLMPKSTFCIWILATSKIKIWIHFWDPDFETASKMLNPKSKIHFQMNTTLAAEASATASISTPSLARTPAQHDPECSSESQPQTIHKYQLPRRLDYRARHGPQLICRALFCLFKHHIFLRHFVVRTYCFKSSLLTTHVL